MYLNLKSYGMQKIRLDDHSRAAQKYTAPAQLIAVVFSKQLNSAICNLVHIVFPLLFPTS